MSSKRRGDWTCPSCKGYVFASKQECYLCQTPKPTDDEMVLVSGEGPRPEARVTPPPAALPPGALPWICQHCGIEHPSRNALFRHLSKSCDPTAAAGPPTERIGEPEPRAWART